MNYIESDNNVIIKDTQSEKEKEFLMPIIERKICKICNRDFSNNNCLGNHIVRTHKISTKNYYDEFLKKIGEGECVVCKKILTFRNLVSGYPTCCHGSCAQRYKLFPENLEKTKRSLEKGKQTCLKRYGVENPFQSEIFKNKSKTTMMKKYGVEHPHHSIEIKKKVKNTCLDRYGVENPFENKNIKDKIKKSLIKRYGVEYIFGSKKNKTSTRQWIHSQNRMGI